MFKIELTRPCYACSYTAGHLPNLANASLISKRKPADKKEWNNMKATIRTVAAWTVLLFGCLLTAHAGDSQDHSRYQDSGIIGVVDTGQFDNGLIPGIWVVTISSGTGKQAVVLETDEEGFFEADLKPGNYILTAIFPPPVGPGQLTPNYIIMGPPTPVKVEKNRFTFVLLPTGAGTALPPLP